MKKSIEVRSPKTRSWKPRRAETIDGKSTRGRQHRRQHQRQLNSDPTQQDVVPKISQNLKKKRTNIDQNNLQHSEKQTHNWEFVSMIYNKYQIISQEMNVRKNKNTKVSLFSVMARSTAHRKGKRIT